jgi:hypothetical protein
MFIADILSLIDRLRGQLHQHEESWRPVRFAR